MCERDVHPSYGLRNGASDAVQSATIELPDDAEPNPHDDSPPSPPLSARATVAVDPARCTRGGTEMNECADAGHPFPCLAGLGRVNPMYLSDDNQQVPMDVEPPAGTGEGEDEIDFELTSSPRDGGSDDEEVDYGGDCDSQPAFVAWPVSGQSHSATAGSGGDGGGNGDDDDDDDDEDDGNGDNNNGRKKC